MIYLLAALVAMQFVVTVIVALYAVIRWQWELRKARDYCKNSFKKTRCRLRHRQWWQPWDIPGPSLSSCQKCGFTHFTGGAQA